LYCQSPDRLEAVFFPLAILTFWMQKTFAVKSESRSGLWYVLLSVGPYNGYRTSNKDKNVPSYFQNKYRCK
jgi:hypothetical protein